jgi:hypothetical protein
VFQVSVTPVSGLETTVDFATSDGTATAPGDYLASSGTITIPAGFSNGPIFVEVVGDTLHEPDETFQVDLSNPVNATIGDAQATATILDDDGLKRVELVHGSRLHADLAAVASTADVDLYALRQRPGSSYEILVDAAGGDVTPLLVERVDALGAVLQTGASATGGSSVSLRWATASPTIVDDERIRVQSGGCTDLCGSEDVYTLRALETTASIARYNNSSSQVTLLVLQNTGAAPVTGTVRFWDTTGAAAGQQAFTLAANASLVLNSSTVAPGSGGSVTIAHDGAYGQLSGKAISVEPDTGFTFDTPLLYRPR